jgi:hypothetical protein
LWWHLSYGLGVTFMDEAGKLSSDGKNNPNIESEQDVLRYTSRSDEERCEKRRWMQASKGKEANCGQQPRRFSYVDTMFSEFPVCGLSSVSSFLIDIMTCRFSTDTQERLADLGLVR